MNKQTLIIEKFLDLPKLTMQRLTANNCRFKMFFDKPKIFHIIIFLILIKIVAPHGSMYKKCAEKKPKTIRRTYVKLP